MDTLRRSFSSTFRSRSPSREPREWNFPDVSSAITMKLDGIEMVFENGSWRIESEDFTSGATGSSAQKKLREDVKKLTEENQLLKFKVEVLMNMLAVSRLDALQLEKEYHE